MSINPERINQRQPPAQGLIAVTPSDVEPILPRGQHVRGFYVGGIGNIAIKAIANDAPVTLTAVPVGTVLWIEATHVYSTGTTATLIVALV